MPERDTPDDFSKTFEEIAWVDIKSKSHQDPLDGYLRNCGLIRGNQKVLKKETNILLKLTGENEIQTRIIKSLVIIRSGTKKTSESAKTEAAIFDIRFQEKGLNLSINAKKRSENQLIIRPESLFKLLTNECNVYFIVDSN